MNNKKNWILIALALLAIVNGGTSQYLEPGVAFGRSDLGFMLMGAILSFAWYYLDSEQIQYQRSTWLSVGVIGIGIVALPYYFFHSRGFKKGLLYTALFLLAAIAWSVLQTAGAYVVYYGVQS